MCVVSPLRENRLERAAQPFVAASDQSNQLTGVRLGHEVITVRGALANRGKCAGNPFWWCVVTAPRSVVALARSTYQSSASDNPRATLCVGEYDSILRAFSIEAQEKRMSPVRNGSYWGTARANSALLAASRSRIIAKS